MMRTSCFKLLTAALAVIVAVSLSGCAAFNHAPISDPTLVAGVEILRAAARVEISVQLRKHGVSAERTQEILDTLHDIADAAIAGEGIGVVLTKRWDDVRVDVIRKIKSAIVTYSTLDGAQIVDERTAEVLATAVVDAFAAALRNMLVQRAQNNDSASQSQCLVALRQTTTTYLS